jgi:CheY-like chemotaxis protein
VSSRAGPQTTPDPSISHATGSILVIDDERSIRDIARRILESRKFRVFCATDGREGLETLATHRGEIVAVILDLTMPHMDGTEFLARLRREYPELPVLVMSGYSEQEVATQIAGLDVRGVIQKPFAARTLLGQVASMLGGN